MANHVMGGLMMFNQDFKDYGFDDVTLKNMEASVKDLYNFYKRFIASQFEDKCEAPHIMELSKILEEMYHGDLNRLCVAMPPRHSKSSLITLAYPFWLILHNPSLKILIINAEAGLSEVFGIRLKELFRRYGAWFGIYLSDVKHANTHLMFEDKNGKLFRGSIRLTGASGSITGHDANYLILDDIYKGYMDITPSLLAKKIEWFKTMITQRLEPTSKLIILHTRWSSDDLIGYLKTSHPYDYKFIEYPAIKDDNTPLWRERYSMDFLNYQKKEMGERLFNCIFQQMPLDDTGDFFKINNLIFDEEPFRYHDNPHILSVRAWDLSFNDGSVGDKKDYTAGVLMSKVNDDYYVIHDIIHGQYGDGVKYKILDTAKSDTQQTYIYIEPGTSGGASEFLFKEYNTFLYNYGFYAIQAKPIGSKADRAYPFKEAILDSKIHVALQDVEVKNELILQLKSFPYGSHDDIIDACAYAFNALKKMGGGVKVSTARIRKWDIGADGRRHFNKHHRPNRIRL